MIPWLESAITKQVQTKIEQNQLIWYEHVHRMDAEKLQKQMLEESPHEEYY